MQSVVFLNVNFLKDIGTPAGCIRLLSFPVKLSSSEVRRVVEVLPFPLNGRAADRYGSIS